MILPRPAGARLRSHPGPRLFGLVPLVATAAICAALVILPPPASADEHSGQPAPTAPAGAAAPSGPAATPAATPAASDDAPDERPALLPAWLRDPSRWAADIFAQTVASLLQSIADFLQHVVGAVLHSSANFITQTPPAVSYASPAVRGLWEVSRAIANAALALAAPWGGFNLLAREHVGSGYHDLSELLSRLVVGALLVNTSLWWGQLAVDVNNALCRAFGEATLPAWERAGRVDQALASVFAGVIYLVVSVLLLLQQLMRLALVDVLLIAAPLGLVCWIVPQTEGWARRWSSTFSTTVFVQFLQVLTLRLGAALVVDLAPATADSQLVTLMLV